MANELTPEKVDEILGNKQPKKGIIPPNNEPSKRIEDTYASVIIDEVLGPSVANMAEQAEVRAPFWVRSFENGDTFWTRELDRMTAAAKRNAAEAEVQLRQSIVQTYSQTSAQTRNRLMRQIKNALNIAPPFPISARENALRQMFLQQNTSLVTGLTDSGADELRSTIERVIQQGDRSEQVIEEIQNRLRISRNRAKLIARDQVEKIGGQLNQARMITLGITHYKWRTARDERVRPAHAEREGVIFAWDNPPSDGHPGQPINCRCYAEPLLDGEDR